MIGICRQGCIHMNYTETEKIIDLKMLLYFILKRWKRIVAFFVAGILLGSFLAVARKNPSVSEMDTSELNLEKIAQYEQFRQLYELQLEKRSASVVLQMNPNEVYSVSRAFYLAVPAEYAEMVRQKYAMMLENTQFLERLIDISGLNCTVHAIREMVAVNTSAVDAATVWENLGFAAAHIKVVFDAIGADEKTANTLMNELENQFELQMKQMIQSGISVASEKLSDVSQFGFSLSVGSAQDTLASLIKTYATEVTKLRSELSEDDLSYHAQVYHASAQSDGDKEVLRLIKKSVKYSAVFAVLFSGMMMFIYAVQFLLDDRIKTAHEVQEYGLYTIACLQDACVKKTWVDRLLSDDRLPENSREYLANALKSFADGKMLLSGEMQDPQIADTMEWVAEHVENMFVSDCLAYDAVGLQNVIAMDGVILFVRLWKTTTFDLKRELDVVRKLNKSVKGVVVLR